jgi:hypothetical protein
MKVTVSITVEVDVEAWANTYGIDKKEVRADVRTYAVNQLQGAAATDEDLWVVKA